MRHGIRSRPRRRRRESPRRRSARHRSASLRGRFARSPRSPRASLRRRPRRRRVRRSARRPGSPRRRSVRPRRSRRGARSAAEDRSGPRRSSRAAAPARIRTRTCSPANPRHDRAERRSAVPRRALVPARRRHYMMVRRFREVRARGRPSPVSPLDLAAAGRTARTGLARCCEVAASTRLRPAEVGAVALPDAAGLAEQANAKLCRSETPRSIARCRRDDGARLSPDRPRCSPRSRVLKPGGRVAPDAESSSPIESVKRVAVRVPALRRALPRRASRGRRRRRDLPPVSLPPPARRTRAARGAASAGLRVLSAARSGC